MSWTWNKKQAAESSDGIVEWNNCGCWLWNDTSRYNEVRMGIKRINLNLLT